MLRFRSVTTIGIIVKGLDMQVDFGDHSNVHDLRFDLVEARRQKATGVLRDQNPGRAHERIDDVTDPQRELLEHDR